MPNALVHRDAGLPFEERERERKGERYTGAPHKEPITSVRRAGYVGTKSHVKGSPRISQPALKRKKTAPAVSR